MNDDAFWRRAEELRLNHLRRTPIRRVVDHEKVARIARGELTPDEQIIFDREQRGPGDDMIADARIANQRRARARQRTAAAEEKQLNRMRAEAQRIVRTGASSPTMISDMMARDFPDGDQVAAPLERESLTRARRLARVSRIGID